MMRPDAVTAYKICVCGCGVVGWKEKVKGCVPGCVVGCQSSSCRNRRNQRKGKRGQANAHKVLGGIGFTPANEESGRTYSVEVQVEVKKGAQVPASLQKFTALEWTRHAFSQASRAIPEGVAAFPAIYAEYEGGGAYLVVELMPHRRKR